MSDVLKQTLEWYADKSKYEDKTTIFASHEDGSSSVRRETAIEQDKGSRARKALEAPPSADAERAKALEALDFVDGECHAEFFPNNKWLEIGKRIDIIRSALSRIGGGEWRTIDSAPRDGSEILVFIPTGDGTKRFSIEVVAYVAAEVYEWLGDSGNIYYPTHWQPLPQPPKINAPGKDGEG